MAHTFKILIKKLNCLQLTIYTLSKMKEVPLNVDSAEFPALMKITNKRFCSMK